MDSRQILVLSIASIALIALLGCVDEAPDDTTPGPGPQPGPGQAEPIEQAIGPDYYESEQAALDALEQDLGEMPELSEPELEALLGE